MVRGVWSRLDDLVKRLVSKRAKRYVELFEGNGYNYEAAEVARRLRAGELESGIVPLDETLSIMETMDRVREQVGLKYQFE